MTNTTTYALPECWQNLEDVLSNGIDRVILYGPPGTGKTFAGMNFGSVANGSFRITCTDDMTNMSVEGAFLPSGESMSFKWYEGKALKAWKAGGRLVVDEIDKAGSDVFATLLNFLDSPESASWEHPDTGEVFRPSNGFSAVMTTNLEDMSELPEALADRFPVRIRINQPHPNALKRLSKDLRDIAVNLADAGQQRISLRTFMAFDSLRSQLGDDKAAKIVFATRAEGILEAIKVNSVA
jgi:MoxR-like ATPase